MANRKALRDAVHGSESEIRMLAGILDSRGWAEGNAGNFSLRLVESAAPRGETIQLPWAYPELAGCIMLVTSTGSRMRDIAVNPLSNLCLVKISGGGKEYVLESEGGRVSSEFPSHLAAHAVISSRRPQDRAFLHTHPTHLLALSHLVTSSRELRATLVKMYPEAALALKNLAVLPYLTPGSEELARATADALGEAHGVVWSGHGMAATAPELLPALDVIEIAEKAARIALLLGKHRTSRGLSRDQLDALYRAFEP